MAHSPYSSAYWTTFLSWLFPPPPRTALYSSSVEEDVFVVSKGHPKMACILDHGLPIFVRRASSPANKNRQAMIRHTGHFGAAFLNNKHLPPQSRCTGQFVVVAGNTATTIRWSRKTDEQGEWYMGHRASGPTRYMGNSKLMCRPQGYYTSKVSPERRPTMSPGPG